MPVYGQEKEREKENKGVKMTEIKEYKRTAKVGDIEVGTYIEKVKVVDGEEVYDDDLFCESMIAENEVVRKYFDLISLDDQIKLPRRYAIPRKYLNVVLDLYEEIWEYETPSSEESDRMKKALKDKEYFRKMLLNADIPEEIKEKSLRKIETIR